MIVGRDYVKMDTDTQVHLQMVVIQRIADELKDMPDFHEEAFRELLIFEIYGRIQLQEQKENYELCALLRDAIKTVQHISIHQLL